MIFTQMIVLFGLIAVGYLANRTGVMDGDSNKKISRLLVNVTIPALILSSAAGHEMEDKTKVLVVLGAAAAMFVVTPLISLVIVRKLKLDNTYELMLNYSNLGFMGIPIISGIYGSGSVFYVSLFMMVFNISLFSHGVYILQRGREGGGDTLKNMLNPGIVSSLAAVAVFLFEVPIPAPLLDLLNAVGGITSPLAMIVIGSTMAAVKLSDVIRDKMICFYTILKIAIYPALIWFLFHFFIQDPMVLGIAVVLSGLPTAGNVSMVCSEYNGNLQLVTKGTFLTTLCSVLTIPVWMSIF
ncbi:AEC family transporter [Paenibacillus sp. CN-4]|uniref:AEC family transporter n=1 Tax=Paenibacillus nanchangensis TaxID=3348343 RepID=UPI00397AC744